MLSASTAPPLNRILDRAGAPAPNADKRYDLSALTAFVAAQAGSTLDTLRGAKLKEVQLRCEKLRRDLDRDVGLTVLRADVDELHGRIAHRLRSLLYSKLENEMPPKMAGADALTLRVYGRGLADEIVLRLALDVERWDAA